MQQAWSGVSEVRRDGDVVVWVRTGVTPTVHRVLRHCERRGVVGLPRVVGLDDTHERLTWMPGEVHAAPLRGWAASDEVLAQVARLLRRVHDATTDLVHEDGPWGLPTRSPREVLCLGDVAPYNTAVGEDGTLGFFDVDTVHPGPRVWDVAYAVYRWAPLTHPGNREGWGTWEEQRRRARLFCDVYQLSLPDRAHLASAIAQRLDALVAHLRDRAAAGHPAFLAHLARGDADLYQRDSQHLRRHARELTDTLTSGYPSTYVDTCEVDSAVNSPPTQSA